MAHETCRSAHEIAIPHQYITVVDAARGGCWEKPMIEPKRKSTRKTTFLRTLDASLGATKKKKIKNSSPTRLNGTVVERTYGLARETAIVNNNRLIRASEHYPERCG